MTQSVINVQQLLEKWAPVLNSDDAAPITDRVRRETTAVLLENTEQDILKKRAAQLNEAAPINTTNGYSNGTGGDGLAKYDPVLISMVRRAAPQMIAYDICGVQPLRAPTGLIFALRSKYGTMNGTEALFDEANTKYSGAATPLHAGTDPTADFVDQDSGTAGNQFGTFTTGQGMTTQFGESLGGGVNSFSEMALSVESMTVTAGTRALRAGYSVEFAQDLQNLHGLNADAELSNILSTEMLSEVNREVLRTMYSIAKVGAQDATTAGMFDLTVDSDGRWLAERHKGLLFQIEREANAIAQQTRLGKGNFIVCSSDVASALALTGLLDYSPALAAGTQMNVDDSSVTFAGILNKRFKVYIDPYAGQAGTQNQFFMVGHKGQSPWQAGLFYCPYVPLDVVKTTDPTTMTPVMAYRMRYGIAKHPFWNTAGRVNSFYRIARVKNLI